MKEHETNGRNGPYPDSHLSTRVAHAGEPPESLVWPLSDPLSLSTVYASHDPATAQQRAGADPPEPNYARDGLPNVRALERAVAHLERADDALAVPSGMAAIAITLLALLRAGDHVITVDGGYCEIQGLLAEEMARFDVTSTCVAAGDPAAILERTGPRTRMIIVESIANPSLRVANLPAIAAGASAQDVLLCVDNTLATPMLCRPLELGADLVWHSATKYLGGHHDLVAGVVAGRRDLIAIIRRQSQRLGMTLGAFDAWLALRGIHTLAPRMAWICDTAQAVARFLEAHPAVAGVQYPGLPRHPDAALAARLLPDGAGGIVTCTLRDGPASAAQVIRHLRLIPFALSLGGTVTTVCYPPLLEDDAGDDEERREHATLRFSIGLESATDLIADLEQALAHAS